MTKVPDLIERCSVVDASEVWNGTGLGLHGVLDLGQRVGGVVRGNDAIGGEHIVGGVSLETTGE